MDHHPSKNSRRKFIYDLSLAALSIPSLSALAYCNPVGDKSELYIKKQKEAGKLGIALVGLGGYAGGQLAPALQQTKHCYLAGIVTGTPAKIEKWSGEYNIPAANVYNYQTFDEVANNRDIDIVYVVLPNSMHAEYVIRAAKAGKHVICEKPMAITVEDCDRMIAACKQAGKLLSIGYRLHFDPYHQQMVHFGGKQVFGAIKKVNAGFGFVAQKGIWRLDKELAGGGPLMDLGIYCVQGSLYTTGLEPLAVTAQEGEKHDPEKFSEVEESLTWQLEMPGNILTEGRASYGDNMNFLKAEAEKGTFGLSPAFSYSGIGGETPNGKMNFPVVNQQALQMDDFAQAIITKRPSRVPGEMGRRDMKILQAIYEAMRTGKRIVISKN